MGSGFACNVCCRMTEQRCTKDVCWSYLIRIKMFKMVKYLVNDVLIRYTHTENEMLMAHEIRMWEENETIRREKQSSTNGNTYH